jgi:hypothetical protein
MSRDRDHIQGSMKLLPTGTTLGHVPLFRGLRFLGREVVHPDFLPRIELENIGWA